MSNADEQCISCGCTNCVCVEPRLRAEIASLRAALAAEQERAERAERAVVAALSGLAEAQRMRAWNEDSVNAAVRRAEKAEAALAAEQEAHATTRESERLQRLRAEASERNHEVADTMLSALMGTAELSKKELAAEQATIARLRRERDEAVALAAAAHEECERLPAIVERAERAEAERDEARAALGRVLDWSVERLVELCPPPCVFDTFGEGMRVAKREVGAIANRGGAPLLAELRSLRAEVERLRAVRDAAFEKP